MKKFEPKLVDRLNVMKEIKPMDQFHRECKEYSIIKAAITYLLYA